MNKNIGGCLDIHDMRPIIFTITMEISSLKFRDLHGKKNQSIIRGPMKGDR